MSGLTVWIPGISESLLSTLFFGFCCNYERYFKYRYMPKYSMFTDALFTPKGDKRKTTEEASRTLASSFDSITNITADVRQSKPLLQSMNADYIL